jgi:hypothetical protein
MSVINVSERVDSFPSSIQWLNYSHCLLHRFTTIRRQYLLSYHNYADFLYSFGALSWKLIVLNVQFPFSEGIDHTVYAALYPLCIVVPQEPCLWWSKMQKAASVRGDAPGLLRRQGPEQDWAWAFPRSADNNVYS